MTLQDAAEQLESRWKHFCQTVAKPASCLFCKGTHVHWNGRRERTASVMVEEHIRHVVGIPCRRVRCGDRACRRSWTLRPPGLAPQRHYQLCVVAHAVGSYLFDSAATKAAIARALDCSRRIIGRWISWVAAVAEPARLQRSILEALGTPVLGPLRSVANLAAKARTLDQRQILARTATVLSLFESLGVARGLEPPGLRGVVECALANRVRMATYASPLVPEFAHRPGTPI